MLYIKTHVIITGLKQESDNTLVALHSMGRQSGNSVVVGGGSSAGGGGGGGGGSSSIALLQERFRQLQKMREKRQEMELLKLFPEPETINQTNRYEPQTSSLMHQETRLRFQDSLSLGLDLYTKQAKPQPRKPAKNPQLSDFLLVDSTSVSTNKPEVDTTLHL